jgi:hypothetical protein
MRNLPSTAFRLRPEVTFLAFGSPGLLSELMSPKSNFVSKLALSSEPPKEGTTSPLGLGLGGSRIFNHISMLREGADEIKPLAR